MHDYILLLIILLFVSLHAMNLKSLQQLTLKP